MKFTLSVHDGNSLVYRNQGIPNSISANDWFLDIDDNETLILVLCTLQTGLHHIGARFYGSLVPRMVNNHK